MDEVTQQNSALVEQNAASVKTLEQQAKAMDERVSAFRLGVAESAPAARVRTSATAKTVAALQETARAAARQGMPIKAKGLAATLHTEGATALKEEPALAEF
jgi:hypothetical protein